MHLGKFIHTKTGKIIASILLGVGLATFFRKVCIGKNCVKYISPPIDELRDKTYKFNDACYTIEENNVSCPVDNKFGYSKKRVLIN